MKVDLSSIYKIGDGITVFKQESDTEKGLDHFQFISQDVAHCSCKGFKFTGNCKHLAKAISVWLNPPPSLNE